MLNKAVECEKDNDPKVAITTTFHQFVIEKLNQHPSDSIAMFDYLTKYRWTFGEIVDATKLLSAALKIDYGLQKGDVVALALPNCAEFVISLLAISRCGGVTTLINPNYGITELENLIKIASPTLWICSPEVLIKLGKIKIEEPYRVILVDFAHSPHSKLTSTNYDSKFQPWASVISYSPHHTEEFTELFFNGDQDFVVLLFSSGITNGMQQKAISITHQNLVNSFSSFKDKCPLNENDVIIGVLPFYYVTGWFMAFFSLIKGAKIIYTARKLCFNYMLEAIQDHKISAMVLVPSIAFMLYKFTSIVNDYNLSSVKLVLCGATPLSPAVPCKVIEKLVHKFGWNWMQGLGMTESIINRHRIIDEQLEKIRSVGILMPFTEAKIVDEDNFEVALGLGVEKVGKLCLHGPLIMRGYKGNNTTANKAKTIDLSGWLHTGDLAYYDEDGFFFIVDRLKVGPHEVEDTILQQHCKMMNAFQKCYATFY